jgi:hypothetical protein
MTDATGRTYLELVKHSLDVSRTEASEPAAHLDDSHGVAQFCSWALIGAYTAERGHHAIHLAVGRF